MAVGSFSAGLSGLNANGQYLSGDREQSRQHQHHWFQVERRDLHGSRQPDRRRLEREPDAGRSRRRAPDRSRRSSARARSRTPARPPTSPSRATASSSSVATNGLSYTRAGNFSLNSEGTLVTPDGFKVQGYTADRSGDRRDHHHQPADRHHGASRRAAVAVGDQHVSHAEQSRCRTPSSATDIQHASADLRLGRRFACHHRRPTRALRRDGASRSRWPGDEVTGGTARSRPFVLAAGSGDVRRARANRHDHTDRARDGRRPLRATVADLTFTTPAWTTGAQAEPDHVGPRRPERRRLVDGLMRRRRPPRRRARTAPPRE